MSITTKPFGIDHRLQTFHLVDGVLNELLSPEARVDTHQQYHFDIAEDIFQYRHRC